MIDLKRVDRTTILTTLFFVVLFLVTAAADGAVNPSEIGIYGAIAISLGAAVHEMQQNSR